MKYIDCHTHTQFSMDSEADINAMIERAIELDLAAYAITDHCECSTWHPKEHYKNAGLFDHFNYAEDFSRSVEAVTALKEKYGRKINLICGTELGQSTQDIEAAKIAASDERLDFIIGSLHQVKGEKDFYYIDYKEMTEDEIFSLLEKYFNEVYQICRLGMFDVLGHLTYSLRYMKRRCGIEPDISRFDEIIAESFREIIVKDKGIEINTSGIRQGFGGTFPSLRYVKMFRDLGGELVTVGSDAHKVEDLGRNIADGTEVARAAGFERLCYFKKHKAYFVGI